MPCQRRKSRSRDTLYYALEESREVLWGSSGWIRSGVDRSSWRRRPGVGFQRPGTDRNGWDWTGTDRRRRDWTRTDRRRRDWTGTDRYRWDWTGKHWHGWSSTRLEARSHIWAYRDLDVKEQAPGFF